MSSLQSSRRSRDAALASLGFVLVFSLAFAIACSESPCPSGSERSGDSCAPTEPGGSLQAADASTDSGPGNSWLVDAQLDPQSRDSGAIEDAALAKDAAAADDAAMPDAADMTTDGGDAGDAGELPVGCNLGYVAQGQDCVRDLCVASATEPAFCGDHASCKDGLTATPTCTCDSGFVAISAGCVDDPCQVASHEPAACGANTTCSHDAQGAAVCTCDAAYDDCNANAADGCELSVSADTSNCGSCGYACASGIACAQGACADRLAAMSGGSTASCAIAKDNDVWCWGSSGVTPTSTSTPTKIAVPRASQISVGRTHACLINEAHSAITCWGDNSHLQLGSPTTTDKSTTYAVAKVRAIAAGYDATCMAYGAIGGVACWGDQSQGLLADGVGGGFSSTDFAYSAAKTPTFPSGTDIVDVGVGRKMACALDASGPVYCWGMDAAGSNAYTPTVVTDASNAPLTDAVSLRVGALGEHACAVRHSGALVCWGSNAASQLTGSGSPAKRTTYMSTGLTDVTSFALGASHSCAIKSDATMYCWGAHQRGQLGIGTPPGDPNTLHPTPELVIDDARRTYAGVNHTFVLMRDGRVLGFGDNYYGELGNIGSSPYVTSPVELTGWP